jgi:hypothetical protein
MVRLSAVGISPLDVWTVPFTRCINPPANVCGKGTDINAIKRLRNKNILNLNICSLQRKVKDGA